MAERQEKVWQLAAAFAARAHAGQVRKDGRTPYAAHPFRVCLTVRHVFGCEDDAALAAALLHDTIEDTPTDYDEIEETFGAEVAAIVAVLTKNMILPEPLREAEYDDRLAAGDWRARLIKLADQYDNLSDLIDRSERGIASVLDKCRRALALAREDEGDHEETQRGIAALKSLMREAGWKGGASA